MSTEDLIDYIVPIVFFIIYFAGALFKNRKKTDDESANSSPDVFSGEDDLTRSIQREIKRKIREKEVLREGPTVYKAPEPIVISNKPSLDYDAEIRTQKAKALEARKKIERLKTKSVWAVVDHNVAVCGGGIRKSLKDKDSLRQAIVLREILGKPVALKNIVN